MNSSHDFEIAYTTHEVRMGQLVTDRFTDDFSHLIIAGGDGSINESINGLKDFIVVEEEGTLLICPKSDEQHIRQIVNDVKIAEGDKYV